MVPTVQSELENYKSLSHSCTFFLMPVELRGRCKSVDWNKMGTSSFIMFQLFIFFWIATFMSVWLCCCKKRWKESQSCQWIQVSRSCEGRHTENCGLVIVGLMCHDSLQMPQARWHHSGWVFWALCCHIDSLWLWEPCEWRGGKIIVFRMQVCYSAVSAVD